MMKLIVSIIVIIIINFILPTAYAVVDPLAVPNNRFGIHLISASTQEASEAATLVNTNGDWGYVTFLIESKDRNELKWQAFFNELRRRHLIPIVRLATKPVNSHWERPYEKEYEAWADFLDRLNWPTKNRYVIVYNEPNHAAEWGEQVDAKDYARTLDKTIDALKQKSADFFILNAGFDASAPGKLPLYQDELIFLKQMNEKVPGIFEKLDGWVSHSYPHPGYVGLPNGTGRGSVRTYLWELSILRQFGVTKNLPVFITETGWKHAEGVEYDPSLPPAEKVADYFNIAFEGAWNHPQVVAVTPFLLNYQEKPFDHFSFKKITGERQKQKILGAEFPDYYPHYLSIKDLPKTIGLPVQENRAQLVKGEIYHTIVTGQNYFIPLTFKNTGQSIWDQNQIKLLTNTEDSKLEIEPADLPSDQKVEPGQEYTFQLKLKATQSGQYKLALNLSQNGLSFDSPSIEFGTEAKAAVSLKIKANLKWKENHFGEYLLFVTGPAGTNTRQITINSVGQSIEFEAPDLLPDYTFDFTLERPFYSSKPITQRVNSGINELDFGELNPNIASAIFNPPQLWKLLPFSN